MKKLDVVFGLKGNQKSAYRQLLKSSRLSGETPIVFVRDVCNFTDLTAPQVRSAFSGLVKKGLVVNRSSTIDQNMYSVAT